MSDILLTKGLLILVLLMDMSKMFIFMFCLIMCVNHAFFWLITSPSLISIVIVSLLFASSHPDLKNSVRTFFPLWFVTLQHYIFFGWVYCLSMIMCPNYFCYQWSVNQTIGSTDSEYEIGYGNLRQTKEYWRRIVEYVSNGKTKKDQNNRIVAVNYYLESMILSEVEQDIPRCDLSQVHEIYSLNKSKQVTSDQIKWEYEPNRSSVHLALRINHFMYYWTIVQFIGCFVYILQMVGYDFSDYLSMIVAFIVYALLEAMNHLVHCSYMEIASVSYKILPLFSYHVLKEDIMWEQMFGERDAMMNSIKVIYGILFERAMVIQILDQNTVCSKDVCQTICSYLWPALPFIDEMNEFTATVNKSNELIVTTM